MDPHKYSQLSLTKEPRQYNGTKTVFSTNGAGTTGHPHAKKKKRMWIQTLHPAQKVTQNRSECKMQNYKPHRR